MTKVVPNDVKGRYCALNLEIGSKQGKTIQLNFVQMPFLGKNISGGTE